MRCILRIHGHRNRSSLLNALVWFTGQGLNIIIDGTTMKLFCDGTQGYFREHVSSLAAEIS